MQIAKESAAIALDPPKALVENEGRGVHSFESVQPSDVKQKSVRGGAVAVLAQAFKFGVQTGSTVVLARLLSPRDFGLQGMVVTMIGFLSLFRDVGLSAATVQRDVITHEQTSTLF